MLYSSWFVSKLLAYSLPINLTTLSISLRFSLPLSLLSLNLSRPVYLSLLITSPAAMSMRLSPVVHRGTIEVVSSCYELRAGWSIGCCYYRYIYEWVCIMTCGFSCVVQCLFEVLELLSACVPLFLVSTNWGFYRYFGSIYQECSEMLLFHCDSMVVTLQAVCVCVCVSSCASQSRFR